MATKPATKGQPGDRVPPEFDQFMVEDAARTIARAHQHMKNKPLMSKVRKHVAGLQKAVTRKAR